MSTPRLPDDVTSATDDELEEYLACWALRLVRGRIRHKQRAQRVTAAWREAIRRTR